MEKTIAVREIASFLYSSGDLTNEFFQNKSQEEGKRAHSYLQNKYNQNSKKEYYIKAFYNVLNYKFKIHGFIDGVLEENGVLILEEIKSTELNLKDIDLDYHQEHLAQLKIYGFMYLDANNLSTINLRLTYINLSDYKTKSFDLVFTKEELNQFFQDTLIKYATWLNILDNASNQKLDSLKNIKFPFPSKRQGQQELMKAVYYTMMTNETLYAIAPTGIGKTMATLFSALKSMTDPYEKLFYLTAKTMGRSVAIDTVLLLEKAGLVMHTIVISSKVKSCMLKKSRCEPEECPYAKGYFNRLRNAIEDIYQNETLFTYEIIQKYSEKHQICSFEFALDLSYFCDLVICDYNYVFDPKAHLVRYFEDTEYKPKILCDEAHNLVERSKDMYSASFNSLIPNLLDELVGSYDDKIGRHTKFFYQALTKYENLINEELFYYSHFVDDDLMIHLKQLLTKVNVVLTDHKQIENKDAILNYYFELKDFMDTLEFFGQNHLFIVKKREDENFELVLKCCDASSFIHDTVKYKTKGTVFFSATLFPIKYYMDLLTEGEGKYIVLESPFDQDNLKLIIKDNISTKYKDRIKTIPDIIKTIEALVLAKKGNYIVFFPSYKYIELVMSQLDVKDIEIIIQRPMLNDEERSKIFNKFKDTTKSHLGLFVLGGSFSEGVDFVGDLLNGVIIVGVGIPQVNVENNLLKEFFDQKYGQGFDYAYTYPGFNKVVQAAGRVIRTENDRGVVILVDERYKTYLYQHLMPKEWSHRITMNGTNMIQSNITFFFNEKKFIS